MASQLSFPRYEVSLVSIKSPNHSITFDTNNITKPSQDANVLHLTNDGESSFIGLKYLQKLYGSDKPLPEIDASTEVQLLSRFADTDETQVTTHRILYTARYDIIFIKSDWERSVQQCVARLRAKQSRKQRQSSRRRRHTRAHKHDGA
ncbi:hypothetical protein CEP54_005691 [Fusarium duplospermum]|uniref:Uncharacterized protein n=1 Tax=Fusarium duplospermum TaxID=1325734 RepID=A0A428QB32_9HYPO|nr:hypothetical protein CEP54_005691 [Fusarium duplospermum]